MVGGAILSFFAALGLVRFGDVISRVHAATKPQVVGLLFLLVGLAIAINDWRWFPFFVVAWLAQLVTVPVSAHMVGRAVYHTGGLEKLDLYEDELKIAIDAQMQKIKDDSQSQQVAKNPENSGKNDRD